MKLSELIINDIKPLRIDSKISDLQLLFNQLTFCHIPVQDQNGSYLGCFSETDAHCFDHEKPLGEYKYALEDFFVRNNTLWLDVLEAFDEDDGYIESLKERSDYLKKYLNM